MERAKEKKKLILGFVCKEETSTAGKLILSEEFLGFTVLYNNQIAQTSLSYIVECTNFFENI